MLIHSLSLPFPSLAACMLEPFGNLVWLDSARSSSPLSKWSVIAAAPTDMLTIRADGSVVMGGHRVDLAPLEALKVFTDRPSSSSGSIHEFSVTNYAIGYMTYEFSRLQEVGETLPVRAGTGDAVVAQFGYYPTLVAIDHIRNQSWLLSTDPNHAEPMREVLLDSGSVEYRMEVASLDWSAEEPAASFKSKIDRLKAYIAAGDLYQANLAQTFRAPLPDAFSPLSHYDLLREQNPAPFAGYMALGERTILSASPERLISLSSTGQAEARPIKGTARREATPEADQIAATALEKSAKDRAENTMIVDLLRNDLSRVCEPGSVEVPQLCSLESYEGLHHLVSVVKGKLKAGNGPVDLLNACFPGGSITGAPKQRAMEIIDELEGRDRGVFCGAMGYIAADGSMDFNIPIRTIEISDNQAELHVGSGITHLSDPEAEYEETLLKAEKMFLNMETLFQ